MNRSSLLAWGALATVLLSFVGMIVVPNWQVRALLPKEITDPSGLTVSYPAPLEPHREKPGRSAYVANGCIYCHSQQVRPERTGADIARGWGQRRSVPRDYVLQSRPLLGTMRTGPDLANIGARQPDVTWHHLHLFDARLVSRGSIMPPFRYLYDVVFEKPLKGYALPAAYYEKPAWIVPSQTAVQLVAYIQQLHQDFALEDVQ